LADITETRIAQIYRRGSLPYWQRRLGDWKRRLTVTAGAPAPLRFNPTRRAVSERGPESAGPCTPEELERIGMLIAEVRREQGEFVSASEFAALLPFKPAQRPAREHAAATA
jgi:hypothetical protein